MYKETNLDTSSVYRIIDARTLSTAAPVTISIDEIGKHGLAYLVIRAQNHEVIHVELDRNDWAQFKASIVDKPF